MALVSISEAARLTGKSRTTIQKYIKQGKLSKCADSENTPKIDTSELLRVFGEINKNIVHAQYKDNTHQFASDELELELIKSENNRLKIELELTKKLLEEKDKRNEDLKTALLVLEDRTNKNLPIQKKWWQIFKK